jgi:hypothetical protein
MMNDEQDRRSKRLGMDGWLDGWVKAGRGSEYHNDQLLPNDALVTVISGGGISRNIQFKAKNVNF